MKEILALGTTGAILALFCKFGIKRAYAWSSFTHEDITKKALDLLEKENKSKAVAFYKDWHAQIIKGSKQPDEKEDKDNGIGTHYYSCVNSKGKTLPIFENYYVNRLGKAMRSARTLFEENYTCAVNLYKSGKTEKAMSYIGRAAHFIEDMSCTVHTANMKYLDKQNNIHFAYEKHSSAVCSKIAAEKYDKRLNKYYEKEDMSDALNKLVEFAGRYTQPLCDLDPKKFDDVAQKTLPYAQQNVMALLLKFYGDCMENKGNFVPDRKKCTFTNAGCKMNMTAGKKGIILTKSSDDVLQKMEINLLNNGTFGIKTNDGGYLNGKLKGYDYPKINTQPAKFRAAAVGTRLFRISTEESGYEKVLTANKGGSVSIEKFRPGDPYQLWIIK